MKKLLVLTLSCAALACSLFAKPKSGATSLLGNIEKMANSLDKSEINGVEGTLPEGKTLRGAVYLFTELQPDASDTKIKGYLPEIKSIDLLNDCYKINLRVISKIAIGLSCEESLAVISPSANGFLVKIESYKTYACNPDASVVGDKRDMSPKYFDKLAKWYADTLIELCTNTSDEDFKNADSKVITSLRNYCAVADIAANKLKAKKWYNEHSIEGLPISGTYYFWGIDESKVDGFSYELQFAFFDSNLKTHFFSVLSNNDSYIDLKENTEVKFNGVVRSVKFSDFGNDYKVSNIVIEER